MPALVPPEMLGAAPVLVGATQTTPENGVAGGINTVHLENGLGEIKANRDDGHGSGSLRLCVDVHAPTSGRRMGAVHAIKWAVQPPAT